MNEHVKRSPDGACEWSCASAATEPKSKVADRRIFRLFVSVDPDDSTLVTIDESRVTSNLPGAVRTVSAENRMISLTPGECEWLLSVLPRALDHLHKAIKKAQSS